VALLSIQFVVDKGDGFNSINNMIWPHQKSNKNEKINNSLKKYDENKMKNHLATIKVLVRPSRSSISTVALCSAKMRQLMPFAGVG